MVYNEEESFKRRDFFNAFADCILDTLGNVFEYYKISDEADLIDFYYKDIPLNENDKVLDLGCGTGIVDIKLSNYFNNIEFYGLDISDELLHVGYNLISASGTQNKVNLKQGDFHYISYYYPENYFDKVILLESFSYSVNKGLLLKEIKKVLKPNGVVYIKDIFLPNIENKINTSSLQNFNNELINFTYLNLVKLQDVLGLFLNDYFVLDNLKQQEKFLTDKNITEKRLKLWYRLGVDVYRYSDLFKYLLTTSNGSRPLYIEAFTLAFSKATMA